MAKSIKKNIVYNVFLNISRVIFPLITAPYVSRVLEPDGVGLFNFANTYATYFALFAALGIPLYGIREIAKIRDDSMRQTEFVSEIMSISVIITSICTLLLFISLFFIPQLHENCVIFLVAGTLLYITPFKIDWFYQGKEEFGYIAFRSIFIKTLSVILLFVLVRHKNDLIIYVALNAACQILNELWNFVKLYRSGIHPHFTLKGVRHIKPLLILFSSSIAIYVYSGIDTLMLGFISGYDDVGYYNCATHITKGLLPLVTSLASVMLPRVSHLREVGEWDEINRLINKSVSVVGFLSVPIVVGVIIIASPFVPLFFGDQYDGTIVPLQILSLTVFAIGMSNIAGVQVLLGFGKDKFFLYSILIGMVVSFVSNLVMIPLFGASGASFSSSLAELTVLFAMLYFIYQQTCLRIVVAKELLIDAVVSLTFVIVAILIGHFLDGWFYVIVTSLSCACLYLLVQFYLRNSVCIDMIKIIESQRNKFRK